MDKPNRLKRHFSILFFGLFFIDGGRHLGHNYFNFLFFFFLQGDYGGFFVLRPIKDGR